MSQLLVSNSFTRELSESKEWPIIFFAIQKCKDKTNMNKKIGKLMQLES